MYGTHKISSEKRNMEFWIGVLIGLAGILLFSVTVMAIEPLKKGQTVSEELELYPGNHQIEEAERYLSENSIKIPAEIKRYCEKYGEEYGICPEVLEAICWTESNCKAEIDNADGSCKGLMQIKPGSHSKRMNRLNCTDLHNAEQNIKVGTDYLAELAEENDLPEALSLYNGQAEINGDSVYVKKVLKIAQALERVHFK